MRHPTKSFDKLFTFNDPFKWAFPPRKPLPFNTINSLPFHLIPLVHPPLTVPHILPLDLREPLLEAYSVGKNEATTNDFFRNKKTMQHHPLFATPNESVLVGIAYYFLNEKNATIVGLYRNGMHTPSSFPDAIFAQRDKMERPTTISTTNLQYRLGYETGRLSNSEADKKFFSRLYFFTDNA